MAAFAILLVSSVAGARTNLDNSEDLITSIQVDAGVSNAARVGAVEGRGTLAQPYILHDHPPHGFRVDAAIDRPTQFNEAAMEAGHHKYQKGGDAIFVAAGATGSVYYAMIDDKPNAIKVVKDLNLSGDPYSELHALPELIANGKLFQEWGKLGLSDIASQYVERKAGCFVRVVDKNSAIHLGLQSDFYPHDLTQAVADDRIKIPDVLAQFLFVLTLLQSVNFAHMDGQFNNWRFDPLTGHAILIDFDVTVSPGMFDPSEDTVVGRGHYFWDIEDGVSGFLQEDIRLMGLTMMHLMKTIWVHSPAPDYIDVMLGIVGRMVGVPQVALQGWILAIVFALDHQNASAYDAWTHKFVPIDYTNIEINTRRLLSELRAQHPNVSVTTVKKSNRTFA